MLDSLKLELQVVASCSVLVLGTKRRSVREQQVVFTAEPSLQPSKDIFWKLVLTIHQRRNPVLVVSLAQKALDPEPPCQALSWFSDTHFAFLPASETNQP